MQNITADWRRYCQQKAATSESIEPEVYVEILPAEPQGYWQIARPLYEANFQAASQPIKCPDHKLMQLVAEYNLGYGCRIAKAPSQPRVVNEPDQFLR